MGFISKIKSWKRKSKQQVNDVTIVIEVHSATDVSEEKYIAPEVCTLCSDVSVEQLAPELLHDAPCESEVIGLQTCFPLSQPLEVSVGVIAAEKLPQQVSVDTFSDVTSTDSSSSESSSMTSILLSFPPTPRHELCEFSEIRGIGKGGFGSVHLVRHEPSGKVAAMKVMDKQTTKHELILREQRILRTVATQGVKGIMEFYGSFHTDTHYFLITEYYPGGDLFEQIYRWSSMPLPLAKAFGAELLLAIKALHDIGVVHRDIKPENVLLSEDGHVALADFGFAKSLVKEGHTFTSGSEMHDVLRTGCGSLHYVAPEVYLGKPYAFEIDVWGFGIILFMMITGQHPWDDTFTPDFALFQERLMNASFANWLEWSNGTSMDHDTRTLLEGLLEKDPSRRLSLEEAMEHPFWGDLDWDAVGRWEVPLPDVGAPPYTLEEEDQPSFSAFQGGSRYSPANDPCPEFEFTSRALLPLPSSKKPTEASTTDADEVPDLSLRSLQDTTLVAFDSAWLPSALGSSYDIVTLDYFDYISHQPTSAQTSFQTIVLESASHTRIPNCFSSLVPAQVRLFTEAAVQVVSRTSEIVGCIKRWINGKARAVVPS